MQSDRDLIEAYQRGDETAFRAFYERHRGPLFVYALSIVRSRDAAEEVLQESFFAFVRRLFDEDGFTAGTSDFRPYLFRSVRNAAIDRGRRLERGSRALARRGADPMFRRGDAGDPANLDGEFFEKLLDRLPPEQREVVILRALGDLEYREIAGLTECSENTVASRYRYGVQKLRAALEPAEGGAYG